MPGSPNKGGNALQNMSWQEKMNLATAICYCVALPALVFMRRRLGFRRVRGSYLIAMAVLLNLIGLFGPSMPALPVLLPTMMVATQHSGNVHAPTTYHTVQALPVFGLPVTAIGLFGLVALAVGSLQNWLRWRDIRRGVSWHTYSMGISVFDFLPVSEYIVHRFIDPLVCLFVGIYVCQVSSFLGGWLVASALALAAFEAVLFEKQLNQNLDTLDGLVDAEVQNDNVKFYMSNGAGTAPGSLKKKGNNTRRPITETAGIATGIAPDVERNIAERRVKLIGQVIPAPGAGGATQQRITPSAAPDNLA